MSFGKEIKAEIAKINVTKAENIAELSAFIRNNAKISDKIEVTTENPSIARRIFKLLKSIYNINTHIITTKKINLNKQHIYTILIEEKIERILKDLSIIDEDGNKLSIPKEYIVSDEEDIRAYLRGIFLSGGSVNDPKTARYHMEMLINNKEHAEYINKILIKHDFNSRILHRKKGYIVYIKEAEKISDFLRMINASNGVLYFEDIRIYRDHKNMTNRLNNCEQANVDKTISTAGNQVEEIKTIEKEIGLDILDEKIKETAEYRLKYPEASLKELSEIITLETSKKISKSGLNHRFRKIKEIFNKIKK